MKHLRTAFAFALATAALGMIFLPDGTVGNHAPRPVAHAASPKRPAAMSTRGTAIDLASRAANANTLAWQVESADPARATDADRLRMAAVERLAILNRDLDLNATQQKRIFEVLLAFSAPPEIPLVIGGRPLSRPDSTLEDAIHDALDSERARIYQESLLDDAAWWDEAFVQIEESMNEGPDSASAGEP